jgi:DNA-directed RNA polymerase specialized sigma24 family protein
MNPELVSYTRLVQQYHAILFRRARMITRNVGVSQTLAEQSLKQLWACRKQVQRPDEVRSFLRNNIRVLSHQWLSDQINLLQQPGKENNQAV